jgi:hypothetical protein
MTTKIRPFHTWVERGDEQPATEVRGEIAHEELVLHAVGREIRLPLAETGSDHLGVWATIVEVRRSLGDGWSVHVEVEHDEHGPPSSSILLFHESMGAQAIRDRAGAAHVLGTSDGSITIWFRPDGTFESSGGGHPEPPAPSVN